jgi:hypothetical protein
MLIMCEFLLQIALKDILKWLRSCKICSFYKEKSLPATVFQ